MEIKNFILAAIILVFVFSCKKEDEDFEIPTVVINELMAVNSFSAMDQNNQFDDWVELYNNTSATVDLSGHYLTDSKNNLSKWKFPSGTSIEANSFLIVWADKDTLQTGLHTNFKLSSTGEKVLLVSPTLKIIDKVEYGPQTKEVSYSRSPNGTGQFVWRAPTWGYIN